MKPHSPVIGQIEASPSVAGPAHDCMLYGGCDTTSNTVDCENDAPPATPTRFQPSVWLPARNSVKRRVHTSGCEKSNVVALSTYVVDAVPVKPHMALLSISE